VAARAVGAAGFLSGDCAVNGTASKIIKVVAECALRLAIIMVPALPVRRLL